MTTRGATQVETKMEQEKLVTPKKPPKKDTSSEGTQERQKVGRPRRREVSPSLTAKKKKTHKK